MCFRSACCRVANMWWNVEKVELAVRGGGVGNRQTARNRGSLPAGEKRAGEH